ncbi:MAG: hypothetical protein MUQ10_16240 [Anaerolineae bacterium]|nr:hypothetical protein [Anaerolineae bacterium]
MMELIDRYVHAVSRQLPRKIREDVEMELRSSLEDSLEARSEGATGDALEAHAVALLKEMGSPEEMAASYQPGSQYLIGPELFPTYKLVTRIVLTVFSILVLVGVAMGLRAIATTDVNWFEFVSEGLNTLITSGVFAFGMLTLIFALIQRFGDVKEVHPEPWVPSKLPAVTDEDVIKRGSGLEKIIGGVIFLAILNIFPHWIGMYTTVGGNGRFIPLLGADFALYLPTINVILVGSIALGILLALQKRWNALTRVIDVVLGLSTMFLFFRLSTGASPFDLSPERLVGVDGGSDALEIVVDALAPVINLFGHWPFTLALIGVSVGTAFRVFRLFKTLNFTMTIPLNIPKE